MYLTILTEIKMMISQIKMMISHMMFTMLLLMILSSISRYSDKNKRLMLTKAFKSNKINSLLLMMMINLLKRMNHPVSRIVSLEIITVI